MNMMKPRPNHGTDTTQPLPRSTIDTEFNLSASPRHLPDRYGQVSFSEREMKTQRFPFRESGRVVEEYERKLVEFNRSLSWNEFMSISRKFQWSNLLAAEPIRIASDDAYNTQKPQQTHLENGLSGLGFYGTLPSDEQPTPNIESRDSSVINSEAKVLDKTDDFSNGFYDEPLSSVGSDLNGFNNNSKDSQFGERRSKGAQMSPIREHMADVDSLVTQHSSSIDNVEEELNDRVTANEGDVDYGSCDDDLTTSREAGQNEMSLEANGTQLRLEEPCPKRRRIVNLKPIISDTCYEHERMQEQCGKTFKRNIKTRLVYPSRHTQYPGMETTTDFMSFPEVLDDSEKVSNVEPPGGSEEFNKLVYDYFLKFVKFLYASSRQSAKLLRPRATDTFKCSTCAREFIDVLSLAQHAFMSRKPGLRTQHLGLHKALCALMGWKDTPIRKHTWTKHLLSESEAMSLRDDLIIWPPVILIHNTSLENDKPDERVLLSIQGLTGILRGLGLGKAMTKLCHGRAANQSIMGVCFHGTYSGLQEAEKLHEFFAENKHGRSEFKNFSTNGAETASLARKDWRNVLYGYLGIAGDMYKLDTETKNRCVIRSKKEIQAIAEASVESRLG